MTLLRGSLVAFGLGVTALLGLVSCGGGGARAPRPLQLVEFLFVDRSLEPVAPTNTTNLPRNAQLLFVFSERLDPASIDIDTIRLRFGDTGRSVPDGSFSVDGNTVRFDPTVSSQGQPRPFGLEPITQYSVEIPEVGAQPSIVRSLDDDPNLQSFYTTFTTSDGFLRELDPPQVIRVTSVPDRFEANPLTGQWPGNGRLAIEFSEAMDPASFELGGASGVLETTTLDVRYLASEQVNIDNGLVNAQGVGLPVPGRVTWDASARIFYFDPIFSFGDRKYVFTAQVFQGLRDLAGNQLVNPRSFGPWTCDGTGIETGTILEETFETTADQDLVASDADWGASEAGILVGQEITTREQRIFGFSFQGTGPDDIGEYLPVISPMVGAALNQVVPNVTPPTREGRRVLWAFSDTEMGEAGTITGASWGPDSNATQAALYPSVILRCGYQKSATLSLSPSFSGNYDGSPTVVYTGPYQVPQQKDVGNTVNPGNDPGGYMQGAACAAVPWNQPLWQFTGFEPWPAFTTFFEWDPGDPLLENDRVMLFDASVAEGDTWQQVRGWVASTFPCSGFQIPGFPYRRMYGVHEGNTPNPVTSAGAGLFNPGPSVTDTAFTITKRISVAQSLFYTDVDQPSPSTAKTFGEASDYRPILLLPALQTGGAKVVVEYQAAQAVEADRRTINQGAPFLASWTEDVNDCDGFACIRWRIRLVSNLLSGTRARLDTVQLPVANRDD